LIKNLTAKERTELEEKILQLSVTNSNSDSLHVKNALSRALVEIAKVDMQNNQKIKDILNLIKLQNTDNTNFIIENTEFQIDFFGENLKSI
jgi:type IV secretory pathway VirB4 component